MNQRRVVGNGLLVVVLFACVGIGRSLFWMPAIASHHGDGVFHDLSRRGVLSVVIPGYSISMPGFDLGKPHRAEYRFGGLANIGPKCGVHLAIRDHTGRWWIETRHLNGSVHLELLNSHGQPVVNVSGRLGDYTWWGFSDLHVLYQRDKSFFKPDSKEEYCLRFSYEPDPALAGYKGFVYVRSGGNK